MDSLLHNLIPLLVLVILATAGCQDERPLCSERLFRDEVRWVRLEWPKANTLDTYFVVIRDSIQVREIVSAVESLSISQPRSRGKPTCIRLATNTVVFGTYGGVVKGRYDESSIRITQGPRTGIGKMPPSLYTLLQSYAQEAKLHSPRPIMGIGAKLEIL